MLRVSLILLDKINARKATDCKWRLKLTCMKVTQYPLFYAAVFETIAYS